MGWEHPAGNIPLVSQTSSSVEKGLSQRKARGRALSSTRPRTGGSEEGRAPLAGSKSSIV